jgi:hypothetical protein
LENSNSLDRKKKIGSRKDDERRTRERLCKFKRKIKIKEIFYPKKEKKEDDEANYKGKEEVITPDSKGGRRERGRERNNGEHFKVVWEI